MGIESWRIANCSAEPAVRRARGQDPKLRWSRRPWSCRESRHTDASWRFPEFAQVASTASWNDMPYGAEVETTEGSWNYSHLDHACR